MSKDKDKCESLYPEISCVPVSGDASYSEKWPLDRAYTTRPSVTLSEGRGTGATAEIIKDSLSNVKAIRITEGGYKYKEDYPVMESEYEESEDTGDCEVATKPTALEQAAKVVEERRLEYGSPYTNMRRTADLWEPIFGHPVTASQVALCQIMLKVARELNAHKDDNIVDIAGYTDVLEKCLEVEGA